MKYLTLNFAGVLLLIFALPSFVAAHANLDHAEPKVGSTVNQSPKEVKIWLSQSVEPAFSTIEVFDSAGKQIDKKDSHVDKSDKTVLIVSVPDLGPGTYKVVWHVVSTDTHKTHGDFKFTVKR